MDREKWLNEAEVNTILCELRRKSRRTKITRRNLILFELATCCGLRVSEICNLRMADVRLEANPALRVRSGKGGKSRTVPLVWDAGTLADVTAWCAIRFAEGATESDWLLLTRQGQQLNRRGAREVYRRACRNLIGRPVTIHAGRHTFVSRALRFRSLAAVRDAAGHSSVATTNLYLHAEEDWTPGSLYAPQVRQSVSAPSP